MPCSTRNVAELGHVPRAAGHRRVRLRPADVTLSGTRGRTRARPRPARRAPRARRSVRPTPATWGAPTSPPPTPPPPAPPRQTPPPPPPPPPGTRRRNRAPPPPPPR